MENVSSVAVWGSLGSSLVLAAFLLVQAVLDPPRRRRFFAFSACWWFLVVVDSLHGILGGRSYEALRIAWAALYPVTLLWLLDYGRLSAMAGVPVLVAGSVTWAWNWELATTVSFPLSFGIAAVAHAHQCLVRRGYASAVLAAHSLAQAMLCGAYYAVVMTGDPAILALGYAQYAALAVFAVLFGWVHLPRELRGRAPVRVEWREAFALIACVAAAEAAVILSLLALWTWPPVSFLIAATSVVLSTLLFFFHHRNLLVIYTDNVTALLEERTSSLREAKAELGRQNEILARKLEEQAAEIRSKAEVIERQRRLELAAQTAGQAAHDIQNAISPILYHINRLERLTDCDRTVREIAIALRSQVEYLMELNAQLLALARRGRVEFFPIRLDDLLRDLRENFPGRNLVVEKAGAYTVRGSWSQLLRALVNLVSNAFESSRERDVQVTVRCSMEEIGDTRRCFLGFLKPGRYVRIEVEDDGPGIPEDVRDKIFEPFVSTKSGLRGSGSGLGLTIVAAVVEDHRGVLDLQSGAEGTCFSIYLPLAELGKDPEEELGGDERVLVVDDDAAVVRQLVPQLQQAGYRVSLAKDGQEAVEKLQIEPIDLLILDLKMPRLCGVETFFASLHVRPGIRAIVHSSYVTDEEVRQLGQLGVSCFLRKPAGRRELLRAIRRTLSQDRVRTSEDAM